MRSTIRKKKTKNPLKSEQAYHQDSGKVPRYYNRPGPGMYEADRNIESESRRQRSPGMKFQREGLARGIFEDRLAKHRFTEYSRAELCFKMLEATGTHANKQNPRDAYGGFGPSHSKSLTSMEQFRVNGDIESQVSKNPSILAHKRQTFLNPSTKAANKDQKEPGFPQTKRPELFPVKAEHSEPTVQYLG